MFDVIYLIVLFWLVNLPEYTMLLSFWNVNQTWESYYKTVTAHSYKLP